MHILFLLGDFERKIIVVTEARFSYDKLKPDRDRVMRAMVELFSWLTW